MLQRAPLGTGAIMATAGAISPIPPLVTEPISARGASAKRQFIEYSKQLFIPQPNVRRKFVSTHKDQRWKIFIHLA
jgi:hypothetical protein